MQQYGWVELFLYEQSQLGVSGKQTILSMPEFHAWPQNGSHKPLIRRILNVKVTINGWFSMDLAGRTAMRIYTHSRLKILVSVLLMIKGTSFAHYTDAKKNPDGAWVCGGAFTDAKKNPDGTWVCGGAFTDAKQNPDGTWAVGWK